MSSKHCSGGKDSGEAVVYQYREMVFSTQIMYDVMSDCGERKVSQCYVSAQVHSDVSSIYVLGKIWFMCVREQSQRSIAA
jgi:hypothetical protein